MKKIFIAAALILCGRLFSQTLYSNSFANLVLQTYTAGATSVQYATVPTGFSLINDGFKNNVGSIANPNKPFNVPALKTTGWAVVYNNLENDTFLVSTSWLDSLSTVNRWVITPPVLNITANTVLTWLAKSPDGNFAESYLVYGTNKTGTLSAQDFAAGDQLYANSAESSTWTRRSANVGNFAGQTLRFAFRNNSNDKYQLWIDDIEVVALTNSTDVALEEIVTNRYILTNSQDSVKILLSNMGAASVNTVILNYTIGNSSVNSQLTTFSNGLGYKQSSLSTFPLPFSVSVPGNYKLKAWVSSVNNGPDQNHPNDTLVTYITVQASTPKKSVLIEQFVSAYDGESPDLQQKTNALQNDSVIVVNVHDMDLLTEPNSAALISAYKKTTSTALFDRAYYSYPGTVAVNKPRYDSLLYKQARKISPAAVSIVNKTYNSTTRELSFTVKADFVGEVSSDLRLNAYLVENNVSGPWGDSTINGYNQLSNFYNVPTSLYYHTGNFSPAYNSYVLNSDQYRHQNTLVHSFDGSFGNPGLIPTTGGTQNQSYQQSYTLTIPTPVSPINKFNADNLYIVGFLAEYNSDVKKRTVLNTVKQKVTAGGETLGLNEHINPASFSVYPNPSTGKIYLETKAYFGNYEIKVLDISGRCVMIKTRSQAGDTVALDLQELNNGVYFLNISSEKGNFIEKIILQKN